MRSSGFVPRALAILLLLVMVLATAPRSASAQGATSARPAPATSNAARKEEATRLKSAADLLMDQDRYADALALYERAYELSEDPAILYNEGRAYEALGDYSKALERLEAFEREAPAQVRVRVPGLHELMADLRGRMATLVVRTSAPNARLLLRQKDEGPVGGERRLPTRAGPASVEVVADGYETFRRDVDLAAGTTLTVDANLVMKKRDPLVVIRTTPSADILFDGRALGRAPLQLHAAPGSHDLVATAEGYRDEHVAMGLALGDRRELDLELQKKPGILARWWFWTAVGAVVVGGATTAFVLTRERPHSTGTFSSGSIAAP
ncbi:MAG: hypothetical protein JWP97_3859 [Labilithrix sp.]|nr:hypothetical protein [Labilithrix sp.]